jgi:hypothetical protein
MKFESGRSGCTGVDEELGVVEVESLLLLIVAESMTVHLKRTDLCEMVHYM